MHTNCLAEQVTFLEMIELDRYVNTVNKAAEQGRKKATLWSLDRLE